MAKIPEYRKEFEANRKLNLQIALALQIKVHVMGSPDYPSAYDLQQFGEQNDYVLMTLDGKLFYHRQGFSTDMPQWNPAYNDEQAAVLCARYHIGTFPVLGGGWCVTNEWNDRSATAPYLAEAFAKHILQKNKWTLKKVRELDKSADYTGT